MLLLFPFALMFALLMLAKPKWALILITFFMILWPGYWVVVIDPLPGLNPQRVMIAVAFVAWLIHLAAYSGLRERLAGFMKSNGAFVFLVLLFHAIAIFASWRTSYDQREAIFAALNQFVMVPAFGGMLLTYFCTNRSFHTYLYAVLICTLLVQLLGVVEFILQQNLFANFVDPAAEHIAKILEGKQRFGLHRISSTTANPLSLAHFLTFVFPISLYFLMYAKRLRHLSIAAMVAALTPLSLAMTWSRAGIVLFLLQLGLVVILLLARKNRQVAAAFLVGGLAVVSGLVASGALQRMAESLMQEDRHIAVATDPRTMQLALGAVAVLDEPVLGHGAHQGIKLMGGMIAIDNYYLTVTLEAGFLGLVVLLGVYFVALRRLRRLRRMAANSSDRWFFGLIFLSIASFLGFQLISSAFEVVPLMFGIAFLALGVGMAPRAQRNVRANR